MSAIKKLEDRELESIPGIGPAIKSQLNKIGIHRITDLLLFLPSFLIDKTKTTKVSDAVNSSKCIFIGVIEKVFVTKGFNPNLIVTTYIEEKKIQIRFIHKIIMYSKLRAGMKIRITGTLYIKNGLYQFIHPEIEVFDLEKSLESVIPYYNTKRTISQNRIRKFIRFAYEYILSKNSEDIFSDALLSELKLPGYLNALKYCHAPDSNDYEKSNDLFILGRKRFVIEELMAHKIILNSAKLKNDSGKTYEFKFDSNLIEEFIRNLDFSLTESQYDAVEEIKKSFSLNHPTSRLIQGDVGSGKTIVVLIASLIACLSKLQTAILVPTEILADQHMKTFNEILKDTNFKIKTLKNNMPDSEKNNIVSELSKGKLDIVIGTHSLLSKQIEFYKLGLVIVDEQHKFGIRQRSALSEQLESPNKMQPHQIFISATPIPRSLSLVLYEGLDYTLIKDLPQGRKTIITKLIHNADKKTLYTSVRNILNKGFQAYWVCPSINQTESSELEYIYDVYEKLQIELKEYSMGMLHGQADKTDNEKAMNNFIMGKHKILVCTTMIEVGVDIENATCIVVEDSNRFGLSQLHQLRGRVGRSNKQSFCYLVYKDNISDDGRARLESLEKNSDGFLIAEEDLKLRGSGDYLGVRQSGYNNNFKLATIDDLITNIEIVKGLKNNIINLRDNNKAKLLSRWGNVESETLRL
tara:strand:- start:902 stop:2980 length:2079 start_codon:yes stop_codon:yes gene_type:complete